MTCAKIGQSVLAKNVSPQFRFEGDLLEINAPALVGEGGVATDHERAADAREIRGQAVGHAVDEMLLLGIAAEVGERQNRDGEARRLLLVRRGGGGGGHRPFQPGPDCVDPHRPGDILVVLLAEIEEVRPDPSPHVFVRGARNENAAGLANAFEPRSDVDAVAEDVVALDEDVA